MWSHIVNCSDHDFSNLAVFILLWSIEMRWLWKTSALIVYLDMNEWIYKHMFGLMKTSWCHLKILKILWIMQNIWMWAYSVPFCHLNYFISLPDHRISQKYFTKIFSMHDTIKLNIRNYKKSCLQVCYLHNHIKDIFIWSKWKDFFCDYKDIHSYQH